MSDITPVKVRELGPLIKAVQPIFQDLTEGNLIEALANNVDNVIDMVSIGARIERSAVENMEVDQLVELAGKVIQVNSDFFTRKVMPRITGILEGMAQAATGSPTSSETSPTP